MLTIESAINIEEAKRLFKTTFAPNSLTNLNQAHHAGLDTDTYNNLYKKIESIWIKLIDQGKDPINRIYNLKGALLVFEEAYKDNQLVRQNLKEMYERAKTYEEMVHKAFPQETQK